VSERGEERCMVEFQINRQPLGSEKPVEPGGTGFD